MLKQKKYYIKKLLNKNILLQDLIQRYKELTALLGTEIKYAKSIVEITPEKYQAVEERFREIDEEMTTVYARIELLSAQEKLNE